MREAIGTTYILNIIIINLINLLLFIVILTIKVYKKRLN